MVLKRPLVNENTAMLLIGQFLTSTGMAPSHSCRSMERSGQPRKPVNDLPMSPSAVGPALVQVKLPPSKFSLMENDADIKLGLLDGDKERVMSTSKATSDKRVGGYDLLYQIVQSACLTTEKKLMFGGKHGKRNNLEIISCHNRTQPFVTKKRKRLKQGRRTNEPKRTRAYWIKSSRTEVNQTE